MKLCALNGYSTQSSETGSHALQYSRSNTIKIVVATYENSGVHVRNRRNDRVRGICSHNVAK
jgi:hypothetical protein